MADLTVRQVMQKLGKDILNWVKTNCVDNLVSTSKHLPLSANQGRVLKEGQDAINQSLDINYNQYIVIYNSSDVIDATHTIEKNGYIQAYAKTQTESGTPFMRLYVNNNPIFEGFAPTGTYKYLWSPLFKVKAGDIIKYTLSTESTDGSCHLRLYY